MYHDHFCWAVMLVAREAWRGNWAGDESTGLRGKRCEVSQGHPLWQALSGLPWPLLCCGTNSLTAGAEDEVRRPMKSTSHYELWFPL